MFSVDFNTIQRTSNIEVHCKFEYVSTETVNNILRTNFEKTIEEFEMFFKQVDDQCKIEISEDGYESLQTEISSPETFSLGGPAKSILRLKTSTSWWSRNGGLLLALSRTNV